MKPIRSPTLLHSQGTDIWLDLRPQAVGEQELEAEVAAFVAQVVGTLFSEEKGYER